MTDDHLFILIAVDKYTHTYSLNVERWFELSYNRVQFLLEFSSVLADARDISAEIEKRKIYIMDLLRKKNLFFWKDPGDVSENPIFTATLYAVAVLDCSTPSAIVEVMARTEQAWIHYESSSKESIGNEPI
ncbi:hypothetical protein H0W91_02645 [Patescibacteria group bacterium]|nr:hypothetical protein [Patescibacteria group bacterium]